MLWIHVCFCIICYWFLLVQHECSWVVGNGFYQFFFGSNIHDCFTLSRWKHGVWFLPSTTSLFLTCHVNHHIAATKSSSILASVPTNLCITLNISSLVTPLVSASKWVHFQIEKSFYLSIHRFIKTWTWR